MPNLMIRSWLAGAVMIISVVATASAQQTITPEKRALIKEFLEVSEMKQETDEMMEAMFAQFEQQAAQLTDDKMPKEQLDKLRADFKRIKELFLQRVNFSQIMDEIAFPLYDKYFTTDDLRGMIAFYKSPAGRKFTEVAPKLAVESMAKMNEKLTPIVQQILREVREEEKKSDTAPQ